VGVRESSVGLSVRDGYAAFKCALYALLLAGGLIRPADVWAAECLSKFNGAIINIAPECLNDTAALVVDSTKADALGWQYSDDTALDGADGSAVGGSTFEIYGLAFRETPTEVWVVIKSNLPLTGKPVSTAQNGSVGWGDLFINLSGVNFLPASNAKTLLGVRFAATNDSGVPALGLYSQADSKSVTSVNSGFASWNAYVTYLASKGVTPVFGDLGTAQTYYDGTISNNVLNSGTLMGAVQFSTAADLAAAGFNAGRFSGSVTVGMRFAKNLLFDLDSDNDGTDDCFDDCKNDPGKIAPGVCGCGVADTNTDGDAKFDCQETCDTDPGKFEPGVCGCGVADTNRDGDAKYDCQETCDTDPGKFEPGVCGCGVADTDSDGDGTADCKDLCPSDPAKTAPGACGCGKPDGGPSCDDMCPDDPHKTTPGSCGCGVADTDTDKDGTPDCFDRCPNNPDATDPGVCGCDMPDQDTDGDGALDCLDGCPSDPAKTAPGKCGCGVADTDSDRDGTADCKDQCPQDPNMTVPGACGCGADPASCLGCDGVSGSGKKYDQCGICGGAGAPCPEVPTDCFGDPDGAAKIDPCGICGGDGSTCSAPKCVEEKPTVEETTSARNISRSSKALIKRTRYFVTMASNCKSGAGAGYMVRVRKLYNQLKLLLEMTIIKTEMQCEGGSCTQTSTKATARRLRRLANKIYLVAKEASGHAAEVCRFGPGEASGPSNRDYLDQLLDQISQIPKDRIDCVPAAG
jgi:hypothetical protein